MNLYEIDSRLTEVFSRAVDPDTGEVLSEDALKELDDLQMDLNQKIENICLYIKNLSADAEAYKKQKDDFAAKEKAASNRVESLKKYLSRYLTANDLVKPWKADDRRAAISWRKTQSVEITDMAQIPEAFLRIAQPTADKTAIKAAIKDGKDVPGAVLKENQNIQIK